MPDARNFVIQLDRFDRAILQIVQCNNQITHSKIGERVGLSNSAVRRRLKALRSSGVIHRDVAILSESYTGVTAIVSATFKTDSPEAYSNFDDVMRADDRVSQAYHVSGSTDYVLIVHARDLQDYEQWAKDVLMSDTNLKRHDTKIVYSCKKFETARRLS